jgi:hypothetical protein
MADRLRIVRPDDLLVLDLHLTNLRPSVDGSVLERVDPDRPARLSFELGPQHVAERAFYEYTGWQEPAGPPPVETLASGPTRLVFDLPDDRTTVPLTLAGLLDWTTLRPRLAPGALPPGSAIGPSPQAPGEDDTVIEFPYRLMLSPVGDGQWSHANAPITRDGRTELWHTRLRAVRDGVVDPSSTAPLPLRALYVRPEPDLFASAMSLPDLQDLVTLTADFANGPRRPQGGGALEIYAWSQRVHELRRGGRIVPPPETLEGHRVVLTSLGASMRLRGSFTFPRDDQSYDALTSVGVTVPQLMRYVHIAGLGRDQYVEVVRRGFVDAGHRAVILRVTERQFEPVQIDTRNGPRGTYGVFGTHGHLRQYYRVLITQPVLDYSALADGFPHGGREMPLRSIEFTTLSSPKLDLPFDPGARTRALSQLLGGRVSPRQINAQVQAELERALNSPRWLEADGRDVNFDFVATDWRGRRISSSRPLLFVPYVSAPDVGSVRAVFDDGSDTRRSAALSGQQVALADPEGAAGPDSTSSSTHELRFTLDPRRMGAQLPGYVPSWMFRVASATTSLEPLQRLTGSNETHEVVLTSDYLDHGLDPDTNPTGGFARLVNGVATVAMGAREGGGLSAPSMDLDMISARAGLISSTLAGGLEPLALQSLFSGMKIFGTVPLAKLLGEIPAATADLFGKADRSDAELDALANDPNAHLEVPVLRSRVLRGADDQPMGVTTRFLWKPVLKADTTLTPVFDVGGASFLLDVVTTTLADGSAPQVRTRGEFRGFSITFAGVARLSFGELRFETLPGRKPDVTAEGVSLGFTGALEFVNTLRDLLPTNGFSDPPAITVDEQGIRAGFSLAIPTIGVGVFSLQNLALSASLSVPFLGKAAGLRFALSERHKPFLVTVTLFGGGGFFALGVSANGVEEIEASIEFGGNVSLNLGVASGGVYVMAGVYFGMTQQVTQLTGYLRMGGHLSVLGLISISLEFYLAFTWRDKGGDRSEIWGQASLSVSVKVAFFSTSVTLSVERRFAGASGDPTLDQVMDDAEWEQYCLAYAKD